MERCRLVFSGSGGQGIITAAVMLAEAAVIHEGLNATQTQSYGPEARGGATKSEVIISGSEIHFPKVNQPNILVCLTQEAYMKFYDIVRPGGILLTDSKLVKSVKNLSSKQIQLPMYDAMMEAFGNPIALSTCMLGALVSIREIIHSESIAKVLKHRVPQAHYDMNIKALDIGRAMGEKVT